MEDRRVTVVMSSYNRLDLLKRTVDSFFAMNTHPIYRFIIVEDSAKDAMHKQLLEYLSQIPISFEIVLNPKTMGVYEAIDMVYATINTPYIFQTEEDWLYHRPGFIENSMKVLESNPKICLVWIRDMDYLQEHPVLPPVYYADGQPFQILGDGEYWHGWSGAPGLRRLADYKKVAPYCQWSTPDQQMTVRECMVDNAFHRLGFISALLPEGYITHIGGSGRSTRGA